MLLKASTLEVRPLRKRRLFKIGFSRDALSNAHLHTGDPYGRDSGMLGINASFILS